MIDSDLEILLVEDNDSHFYILEQVLALECEAVNLHRVSNGHEALCFLHREGINHDSPRPNLILLDLKLPGLSGLEVLEKVKSNKGLRRIPVVILSTSDTPTDRDRALGAHANSYVTKPIGFEEWRKLARQLTRYWGNWDRSTVGESE